MAQTNRKVLKKQKRLTKPIPEWRCSRCGTWLLVPYTVRMPDPKDKRKTHLEIVCSKCRDEIKGVKK